MNIGDWVRRRGKWHLVESVVAGDAVTRCGRRMDRVTASGGELQVSEVMPLTRMISQPQLCKQGCERPDQEFGVAGPSPTFSPAFVAAGIPAEDDPSTSPVDPVTGIP